MAVGTDTIDFGAFPGSLHTTKVVTGQAGIIATSKLEIWLDPSASADHSPDEHKLEPIKVTYDRSKIVPGTGFTIEGFYAGEHSMDERLFVRNPKDPKRNSPRAYGIWNVCWGGDWT